MCSCADSTGSGCGLAEQQHVRLLQHRHVHPCVQAGSGQTRQDFPGTLGTTAVTILTHAARTVGTRRLLEHVHPQISNRKVSERQTNADVR